MTNRSPDLWCRSSSRNIAAMSRSRTTSSAAAGAGCDGTSRETCAAAPVGCGGGFGGTVVGVALVHAILGRADSPASPCLRDVQRPPGQSPVGVLFVLDHREFHEPRRELIEPIR